LEEDVAKSFHFATSSGVDFNRAGTPLMECVSEPDLRSPDEAFAYLTALKEIFISGGVSDCDMEKGQLRCDCNVSVRPVGQQAFGEKIEIKNMNSISGVRRAVAHPDYIYAGVDSLDRVAFDVALLQLDQPVRLPSVTPFQTDARPQKGDKVGIVSYAQDRADAPSLQEVCHVLDHRPGMLVLSCNVDFGSSGAPIFVVQDGVAKVVSVVSAKAEVNGVRVALGTALQEPLTAVQAALAAEAGRGQTGTARVRLLSGGVAGGAKFVKP